MALPVGLKLGSVCHVHELPDLDSPIPKRHFVVVVHKEKTLTDDLDAVLVVGISTKGTDADRVSMPIGRQSCGTNSGLKEPCDALPRWFVLVAPRHLDEIIGEIPRPLVQTIQAKSVKRYQEWMVAVEAERVKRGITLAEAMRSVLGRELKKP